MKTFLHLVLCLVFTISLRADDIAPAVRSSAGSASEVQIAQPELLRISATVDGTGKMVFTRQSLHYEHKEWDPPTNVTFDGQPWSDLTSTPPAWLEMVPHLDLTKAWIVKRQGRDVIALEQTPDGFDLDLCDSPNGAAEYEVVIAVPRRDPASAETEGNPKAGADNAAVETRSWHQGEPPVRLIRQEQGFCALTSVSGHFQGGGEDVRVYVGDDGFWYLGGKSRQKGVSAECIIVHYSSLSQPPAPRLGRHSERGRTSAHRDGVRVLAASYSFGSLYSDVTTRVRELLKQGGTFQANPGCLLTDPKPGWNKALVIFCKVRGKRAIFSVGEGENVSRDLLLANARLVPDKAEATPTTKQVDRVGGNLTLEAD